MFDEIHLSLPDWIFVANGLVIGASLHLYKRRIGEPIWQSIDDEVDDRLAAYVLAEILHGRNLLGDLAENRPNSLESDRWSRWKERVDRSNERSVTIRLSDIPYIDGVFAKVVKDSSNVVLDIPIAQLPPSNALRYLNFYAKIHIQDHTEWVLPQDRWENEDPFITPIYHLKLKRSFGPKLGPEVGLKRQARYVLEALAAESDGKRMSKEVVIEILKRFNCTAYGAKQIWQDAELPKEWKKSGRIAEEDRLPGEEFSRRLRLKGITSLSGE